MNISAVIVVFTGTAIGIRHLKAGTKFNIGGTIPMLGLAGVVIEFGSATPLFKPA